MVKPVLHCGALSASACRRVHDDVEGPMDRTHESNGAAWTWDSALTGVVPPLISPLQADGEADAEGCQALVDYLLEGGCTGLFVAGGCGEGAWLTTSQRTGVVRALKKAARGVAPVLVGVMLPATGPAIEAAKRAADDGADALVAGSPYYFHVDGRAQRRHVEAILDAVPLPVLLYNIPPCTHHALDLDAVRALAANPRVIGIKDSSGDFGYFQRLLAIKRDHPSFRVLQGSELLASSSLLAGGDGLVPGLGNVAPRLLTDVCRAAARGDAETCRDLQRTILDLIGVFEIGGIPGLKAACSVLGIGNGLPAAPWTPVEGERREAIAAVLRRNGLLRAVSAGA